jgi:hypothetical protein
MARRPTGECGVNYAAEMLQLTVKVLPCSGQSLLADRLGTVELDEQELSPL